MAPRLASHGGVPECHGVVLPLQPRGVARRRVPLCRLQYGPPWTLVNSGVLDVAFLVGAHGSCWRRPAVPEVLTYDKEGQSNISRRVAQIGSKELAPPSLALEPPPGLTEQHGWKRDHSTMMLEGRDDGAAGASHGQQLALPRVSAGAATAGATGSSAATGAERLGGPPPRFCPQCAFEWAGPTAMFCSACGWKRP